MKRLRSPLEPSLSLLGKFQQLLLFLSLWMHKHWSSWFVFLCSNIRIIQKRTIYRGEHLLCALAANFIEMQNSDSFEVRGTIKQLGVWHKPVTTLDDSGMVQGPCQFPKRELDPNTIALEFAVDGLNDSRCYLLVKREEDKTPRLDCRRQDLIANKCH
jgi:hypothetical protein